jgi:hypothetical protein
MYLFSHSRNHFRQIAVGMITLMASFAAGCQRNGYEMYILHEQALGSMFQDVGHEPEHHEPEHHEPEHHEPEHHEPEHIEQQTFYWRNPTTKGSEKLFAYTILDEQHKGLRYFVLAIPRNKDGFPQYRIDLHATTGTDTLAELQPGRINEPERIPTLDGTAPVSVPGRVGERLRRRSALHKKTEEVTGLTWDELLRLYEATEYNWIDQTGRWKEVRVAFRHKDPDHAGPAYFVVAANHKYDAFLRRDLHAHRSLKNFDELSKLNETK